MSQYTFYSDVADGQILSSSATYATAAAGSGTITVDTTNTGGVRIGQQLSAGTYNVWQTFLAFDTSGLPSGETIVGAQLDLFLVTDSSTTDFTLEVRAHDWGSTLEGADFVAASSLSSKTLVASLTTAGIAGAIYKTFVSDPAFGGQIAVDGWTRMVVHSSRQRTATAPSTSINEFVDFRSGEGVAGNQPRLTVFTVPSYKAALGTNTSKSSGTSIAITTTNAVAAGESILVGLAMDPAAGTISATDSASNTYTVSEQVTNGSGTSGARVAVLSAHNVSALAAGSTITVTHPSAAARAVSAASFVFKGTGVKVKSVTATGATTTPGSSTNSPLLSPVLVSAIAVEGPVEDVFNETGAVPYVSLPTAGTTGGSATSNMTLRWAWAAPIEEIDHVHSAGLATARTWAEVLVVFDTTTARVRTFIEDPGYRQPDVQGACVVEAGFSYNPATNFATALIATVNDPTLTIYYAAVIGGVTYGGTMTYGETKVALPASTVGVVIDSNANVDLTGLDYGVDLRVPA